MTGTYCSSIYPPHSLNRVCIACLFKSLNSISRPASVHYNRCPSVRPSGLTKRHLLSIEGLYYPCSENKEADLRLCFRICKTPVSSRRGPFQVSALTRQLVDSEIVYVLKFKTMTVGIEMKHTMRKPAFCGMCESRGAYLSAAFIFTT